VEGVISYAIDLMYEGWGERVCLKFLYQALGRRGNENTISAVED